MISAGRSQAMAGVRDTSRAATLDEAGRVELLHVARNQIGEAAIDLGCHGMGRGLIAHDDSFPTSLSRISMVASGSTSVCSASTSGMAP